MTYWLIEFQIINDPNSYSEVIVASDENSACKLLRQRYTGYDIDISSVARY